MQNRNKNCYTSSLINFTYVVLLVATFLSRVVLCVCVCGACASHVTDRKQRNMLKWSHFHVDLTASIADSWNKNIFTDVTFHVAGFFIKAHKAVLASGSPFFKRILSEYDGEEDPHISLDGLEKEHFELVLIYLYKGRIFISKETLEKVKSLLDMFEISFESDNEIFVKEEIFAFEEQNAFEAQRSINAVNEEDPLLGAVDPLQDEEMPFQCASCDFQTGMFDVLNSHIEAAHAGNSVTCDTVMKSDQMEFTCQEQQPKIKIKKYKCDMCKFQCFSKNEFLSHSELHGQLRTLPKLKQRKKSYSCKLCPATFDTRHQFNKHQNKIIKLKCRLCDFLTCDKVTLNRHLIHRHQVDSLSEYGNVQGKAKQKVVQHKCEQCLTSFFNGRSLKRHKDSPRRFACHHCDYITCTEEIIRKHESDIHGAKEFTAIICCSLCDYKTTDNDELLEHRKSQHWSKRRYRKKN